MASRVLKVVYPQVSKQTHSFKLFSTTSSSSDVKAMIRNRFAIPSDHRLILTDHEGADVIIDSFLEHGDYVLRSYPNTSGGGSPGLKYAAERRSAIEAVRKACLVCQSVQNALVADKKTKEGISQTKEDASPVTVADFAAQALVILQLLRDNKDSKVVGEEEAKDLKGDKAADIRKKVIDHVNSVDPGHTEKEILAAIDHGKYPGGATGRHWALDPIDGTKGFLRVDQYAVALGLIEDGKVVLGVLGCPNLPVNWKDKDIKGSPKGAVFLGVHGEGSYMIPLHKLTSSNSSNIESIATKIQVSDVTDPKNAYFLESLEAAHSDHIASQKIAALLGMGTDTNRSIRMDSQAKYAALARGDAPIYLRLPTRKGYQEKIWDHVAGVAVIEAAGGKVTDIHGKPLDFSLGRTLKNNEGVVATNGKIHEKVVAAVGKVMKELEEESKNKK